MLASTAVHVYNSSIMSLSTPQAPSLTRGGPHLQLTFSLAFQFVVMHHLNSQHNAYCYLCRENHQEAPQTPIITPHQTESDWTELCPAIGLLDAHSQLPYSLKENPSCLITLLLHAMDIVRSTRHIHTESHMLRVAEGHDTCSAI